MKNTFLPFQIGEEYENWEFDLEVLDFERIKWLDSYLYINDGIVLYGQKSKYVEMIFCWDILAVVILVFDGMKEFYNNFLLPKNVEIKTIYLNNTTYLVYGKEKYLEQLINSLNQKQVMKPRRTLVLGDQHGALKAVQQVLERCQFNPQEDLLINLGDVVDGWSESSQLVQFYIELSEKCRFKPIFIKGNHDALCEEWIKGGLPDINWLMQGGKSTVESYIDTGYINEDPHLEFFNNMKDFYVDEENRGYVHAGFTSPKGLGFEENSETYYWDRSLWFLAFDDLEPENPIFKVHKEVFIGHTPTLNFDETTPMNEHNIWNIDTGSAYTGKITILDVETKEFWQSDIVMDLYPDEEGRNK